MKAEVQAGARPSRPRLSRDRIAAAALALVDGEGFEALSMRRLASELETGTMTLYRYFRDKQELVNAMVDTAAAETIDVDPSGPWKDELRKLMWGVRATLARHPVAIRMRLETPLLSPGALRVTEAGMQVLERAGFDKTAAAHAYRTLFLYTFGFAAFSSPDAPAEVRRQTLATLIALPPEEYPALSSAAQEATETMTGDEQFEFGLDLILSGLETFDRTPG